MKDAPWRSFPVTPDTALLINRHLRSAHPPPGAIYQYPGSYRPGNNAQSMPGIASFGPNHDILCVAAPAYAAHSGESRHQARFAKYAYL